MPETLFELDDFQPPRSLALIGEEARVKSMPIREFKYSNDVGPYARNYYLVVPPLNSFLSGVKRPDSDTLEALNVESYGYAPYNSLGRNTTELYDVLKSKLIAPSVITGDIIDLRITEAVEDQLPATMVNKFTRFANAASSQQHIEGFDSYYVIDARLKLGRQLASVACGVFIAPYAQIDRRTEYSHIRYKTRVEKFLIKDSDELRVWQESIQDSKARDAVAKNTAWQGGLISPR